MLTYTIGIRHRFWPFWTKYLVVGHAINSEIPGSSRLALKFLDGSVIIIPKYEEVYFKIFPDKLARDVNADRLRQSQQAPLIKDEPNAELPG